MTAQDVKIVDFPETRVAVLEHRGDPKLLEETIRRFIDFRREHNLPPSVSTTFNVFYPPQRDGVYRCALCAGLAGPLPENAYGVVERAIPGARCATIRHTGPEATLGQAVELLYREWLPASGEKPGAFPLFFHRVNLGPDISENEQVTDIYLPLQ